MVFVDVVRAIYDYTPQSTEELLIQEGDLLFVLEKSSEDDWWKCKKKAASDDDDEPEGLVPNNYVEKVPPVKRARALYDYTKQTDEELSFREEERLDVYDESDPDWTLVGCHGEYGFAPAIYIEAGAGGGGAAAAAAASPVASPLPQPQQQRQLAPPPMPMRPSAPDDDPLPGEADYPDPGQGPTPSPEPPSNNPAAALAGIIQQKTGGAAPSPTAGDRGLASPPLPSRPQYTPDESEEEEAPPPMPRRPQSQALPSPPPTGYAASPREPPGVMPSPPTNRHVSGSMAAPAYDDDVPSSPAGFRMYNIHEMVSHMGKNKKMPTVLGINILTGVVMIAPEKSKDGPSREWTAEKLTHYSIEGKHVFVELVRPSKSVDFHAGSKDAAQEIVAHLGELAGASRGEGLREIYAAASGSGGGGTKRGRMLYEFMAQSEDEVTVAVDDEVIVLDDTKSEEWWMVRRLRNGKEGVVPSSYVEITGTLPRSGEGVSGLNAARSTVEQNRMEEERLAKEAMKKDRSSAIPERHSSLAGDEGRRSSRSEKKSSKDQPKSKPNMAHVRTWTDRSGTFKVEAEFIGLRDGKIHLHKLNGVKIAVPVSKMAVEDLEYVERATGKSLDEDKPLSDIKRRNTQRKKSEDRASSSRGGGAGASVQKSENEYDWFDFFLSCGVNPQICERYAGAFSKDQMGPEILPEVNEQLLRTLGLKEGDILRVMKHLDNKYGRKRGVDSGALPQMTDPTPPSERREEEANGGLFSGPGGALRNNTRKGRPAPAVQTNDVVDEDAFKQRMGSPGPTSPPAGEAKATPLANAPQRTGGGFEDDAWDVKPARSASASAAPAQSEAPKPAEPPRPQQNDDLSLLAMPLQPQPTAQQPSPAPAQQPQTTAPVQSPQQTATQQPPGPPQGADQALFEKIAALKPQPTAAPRQRPAPPMQQPQGTGPLAPPPRAASAPGFNQQQPGGGFGPPPLQPQLTGYQPQQQPMQTGMYPNGGFQQPGYPGMPPQQTGMPQPYPGFQQPQATGMAFQPQSTFGQAAQQHHYGGLQGMAAQQPTGMYQQQLVNGAQTGSPFADPTPRQFTPGPPQPPSGLANSFSPQQTGFAPQQTGFGMQQPPPQAPGFAMQQPTGMNGYPPQQQQQPQLPPQQTGGVFGPGQQIQPLVPQKTGPPPPVRFGVAGGAKPLSAQPTGRANLAKASKSPPDCLLPPCITPSHSLLLFLFWSSVGLYSVVFRFVLWRGGKGGFGLKSVSVEGRVSECVLTSLFLCLAPQNPFGF